MSDPEHGPRRYTEKEVALILRRATELHTSEPSALSPFAFSLTDLEEIAVEAGIDVQHLRQAAAELDISGSSSLGTRLAGAPITIRLERTVPGELPVDRLDDLIPLIQVATEGQGQASAVGKTLTWRSSTASQMTSQQVLVSSKDGETLIRVEEGLGQFASGLFGGVVGGVGGGVGLGVGAGVGATVGSLAWWVGFPILVIGASYLISRWIFTAIVAQRRRRLVALMDQIVEQVEEIVFDTTLPGSASPDAIPPPADPEPPGAGL
jgi:hypothetical protein